MTNNISPGGQFSIGSTTGAVGSLSSSVLWVGPEAPSGDNFLLWINTEEARLYGYWNDGESSQWVDLSVPFGDELPSAIEILAALTTIDGAGSGLDADLLDGQQGAYYLPAADYVASDILAKLLTVDGDGSNLNADLLDGQHGTFYRNASNLNSGTVPEARLPAATDTSKGVVEKSTSAENTAGAASDKYPDVAGVKEMLDTFAEPAGTVGLVPLATLTASTSSSLDFTAFDSSKYHSYMFIFKNVLPATDSVSFRIRYSTDGGTTFIAGGSYVWTAVETNATPSVNGRGSTGSDEIIIGRNLSNSSNGGLNGTLTLIAPDVNEKTHLVYENGYQGSLGPSQLRGTGRSTSVTVVDAVRFFMGAGNITSGSITMYGLLK